MSRGAFWHIANNWLHDVGTGLWVACLIVVLVLAGRRDAVPWDAAAALAEVMRLLAWIATGALVLIGATGGFRLRYWRAESDPTTLAEKRRMLRGKHLAFLAVYGAGTVWVWLTVPAA